MVRYRHFCFQLQRVFDVHRIARHPNHYWEWCLHWLRVQVRHFSCEDSTHLWRKRLQWNPQRLHPHRSARHPHCLHCCWLDRGSVWRWCGGNCSVATIFSQAIPKTWTKIFVHVLFLFLHSLKIANGLSGLKKRTKNVRLNWMKIRNFVHKIIEYNYYVLF